MKLLIPFVLIITLVSCTNKTKLFEKCADSKFLDFDPPTYNQWYSFDIIKLQRDLPNLTLQEKLDAPDSKAGEGKLSTYSQFFADCETLYDTNPNTFKAMYD